jgi:hypothetical protein
MVLQRDGIVAGFLASYLVRREGLGLKINQGRNLVQRLARLLHSLPRLPRLLPRSWYCSSSSSSFASASAVCAPHSYTEPHFSVLGLARALMEGL